jgi:hypothetical protein
VSLDHGRANVLAAKRLPDSLNVMPTFEQMRRPSKSFGLRFQAASCPAILGGLSSRLAGPTAMFPFCSVLPEEMTFMVPRVFQEKVDVRNLKGTRPRSG